LIDKLVEYLQVDFRGNRLEPLSRESPSISQQMYNFYCYMFRHFHVIIKEFTSALRQVGPGVA
jgi:hypothetical protein